MCRYCREDQARREPLRKITFLSGTFINSYISCLGFGREMIITEYGTAARHHKIAIPVNYCPVCGRPMAIRKKK